MIQARMSFQVRRSARLAAVAVLVCGLPLLLFAGSKEENPARPGVANLSWMAGTWKGTLFGGPLEETWSQPAGGVMIGMSRIGQNSDKSVYEFMMIEEKEGHLYLLIRHFKRGLKSVDREPLAFKLVKQKANEVVFEHPNRELNISRITYVRRSDDSLLVRLENRKRDKPQVFESVLKRTGSS